MKQLSNRNCTLIPIKYKTVIKVNNYHKTVFEEYNYNYGEM